jgi:hypothetical protein
MGPMPLLLVPLVGPFHRRFPRYNATTVQEIVAAATPDAVATTAFPEADWSGPGWRDLDEPALAAALDWAVARDLPVHAIGEPSPDPGAPEDFRRILRESTGGHPALDRLDEAERPLAELLGGALDLGRVRSELEPLVAAVQDLKVELFGDGPGTDWLEVRADAAAARARSLAEGRTVLLAPIEQVPALRRRLDGVLTDADDVPPSDAARQRALLDTAFAGEADDPAGLLSALRGLDQNEARLAEAETLLRHGHAAEALEVLIETLRGDLTGPAHLPGWLLARLGQLYDLDGRRDDARKAYRGVLALDWAPPPAREAAREGLERPFRLDGGEGTDGSG